MEKEKKYTVGDFSKMTHTSIRTLYYYDEIGLLKPAKHPDSGYRIYDDEDIMKLHKIAVLKFLGYNLEQIREMMNEPSFGPGLRDSLQVQKMELEKKKERIELALKAINRTLTLLEEEGEVDSATLVSLIHSIENEMEQRDWFTQRAPREVVERIFDRTDEEMTELDKVFIRLSKKVKALVGRPPHDPEVQEMVDQYVKETLRWIGEETLSVLTRLDPVGTEEIAKRLPSPFTKEEEEWLNQAMEHYMVNNGMYEPNV